MVIRHKKRSDFVSNVVVPAGQVVEVPVRMKAGEPGGATFFQQPAGERGKQATAGEEQPEFFGEQSSEADSSSGGDPTVWYITSGSLAAGAVGAGIWTAERAGQLSDCDNSAYHCENEKQVRSERNLAALTTVLLGAGAIGALVYGLMIDADNGAQEQAEEAEPEEQALACSPTLVGARCAIRF